jgi:hypothetical protein
VNALPPVPLCDESTGYVPLAPGSVVGPYRLIRELGRGGMSLVWLAERVGGLLKADPIYDGVRGDPRFHRLLQRMGLAE